jgi:CO/xanthine dehydrogenase FAD-binding subunit
VDLKDLAEANGITVVDDCLRIGALVTAAELSASTLIRREAPILAEAAALTSAPALRSRGTVGGNIVTPHPAGDLTTALLALNAVVEIVDPEGTVELPLSEVVRPGARAWPRKRLIVAVRVGKNRRSTFEKLGSRAGFSRSIVATGICVTDDGVRLALGGLDSRPFRALETESALVAGAVIDAVLARECRLVGQNAPSRTYRLDAAAALIRRGLARLRR